MESLITAVAVWRCKCGIEVKVVTETDGARIGLDDRVIATCPLCRDEHVLSAHRVISITTDREESARLGNFIAEARTNGI